MEQQLHSISSMSTTILIVLDEFSTKSHTSEGILPESEVPLRSKHSKEDINPISEGILPLNSVKLKRTFWANDNFPISEGTSPVNLLPTKDE